MIPVLIFSRDRPAQLDLCLRSLIFNLGCVKPVTVLYKATNGSYQDGYTLCEAEHPMVRFIRERDFRGQTLLWLAAQRQDYVTTLCDDDVAFREPDLRVAVHALEGSPDAICFSLRLGKNTTRCYPMRSDQSFPAATQTLGRPENKMLFWPWADGEGDTAYPGSLDGHIWRPLQLMSLISGGAWGSPNQLEAHLATACKSSLLPLMVSFTHSCIVGVPVNSVQDVQGDNRHGESFPVDPYEMNDRYLFGERLDLGSIDGPVDGAHQEFDLRWTV